MKIESVHWLSREAEEAEVKISGGDFTCDAFSQPCLVRPGDTITQPLHVFDLQNAMITNREEIGIWPASGSSLARKVVAILCDQSQQIFAVGGLSLMVDDHLPGGLQVGDRVEFDCARIDLW